MLSACEGPQSALAPAGRGAEVLAGLFWWMAIGAAIIWVLVLGLGVYAIRVKPGPKGYRAGLMIIGGGAIVPTIVLSALLIFGLALLPDLVAPAPEGSLKVAVVGEQWWWRVRYEGPDGQSIELANEIHLPVGEPVEFRLDSADVIHSFWIPSLGGKVDMIPGRQNRLALLPTKKGVFRGVCAEYCGASHALMAFWVVVEEREDFDRWLADQSQPAREPTTPDVARGLDVFTSSGCAACHTLRGTPAAGVIGPDLTHVGSRRTLAAATLSSDLDDFVRWIDHSQSVKPEVNMPSFGMLPTDDLQTLAAYLESLK